MCVTSIMKLIGMCVGLAIPNRVTGLFFFLHTMKLFLGFQFCTLCSSQVFRFLFLFLLFLSFNQKSLLFWLLFGHDLDMIVFTLMRRSYFCYLREITKILKHRHHDSRPRPEWFLHIVLAKLFLLLFVKYIVWDTSVVILMGSPPNWWSSCDKSKHP